MTAQFDEIVKHDLSETPTVLAMIHFRNKLIEFQLAPHLVDKVVAKLDITLPQNLDEETMEAVFEYLEGVAKLALHCWEATTIHFNNSEDVFFSMFDDVELKIT